MQLFICFTNKKFYKIKSEKSVGWHLNQDINYNWSRNEATKKTLKRQSHETKSKKNGLHDILFHVAHE